MNDDLFIAHDYREQKQSSLGNGNLEKFKENYKNLKKESIEHIKKVFPKIDFDELSKIYTHDFPTDTKNDEPITHYIIKKATDKVEAAANEIGYSLRGGVSIGALFSDGIQAMQAGVMTTNASIIMITDNMLIMFTRLSKLIALSLAINVKNEKFSISYNFQDTVRKLLNNEDLQQKWVQFFFDYAVNPDSPHKGPVTIVPDNETATLLEDISESMLLFTIAHEYGHHIANHGFDESCKDKNSKIMEVEADLVATHICTQVGVNSEMNFIISSNLGAVSFLAAFEYCKDANAILSTGKEFVRNEYDSHPPLDERLKTISGLTKEITDEDTSNFMLKSQDLFVNLIRFVWLNSRAEIFDQYEKGTRPVNNKFPDWLP